MNSNKPLVIYHSKCHDGFTAAWVFHHLFGQNVEFFAAAYNKPVPDIAKGRSVVYLVDFSYKLDGMLQLIADNDKVVLLDHHATPLENLASLFENPPANFENRCDLNRSGATLAWDYLFPHMDRPHLLNHVEDRDLWRFKLDQTRNFHQYLQSVEMTFESWDAIMLAPFADSVKFFAQGEALLRKYNKDIADLASRPRFRSLFGYDNIPVVNCPGFYASDVGDKLYTDNPQAPFSMTFSLGSELVHFSLRSRGDTGIDVSKLAKIMGGGGHEHAAGFTLPYGELAAKLFM